MLKVCRLDRSESPNSVIPTGAKPKGSEVEEPAFRVTNVAVGLLILCTAGCI